MSGNLGRGKANKYFLQDTWSQQHVPFQSFCFSNCCYLPLSHTWAHKRSALPSVAVIDSINSITISTTATAQPIFLFRPSAMDGCGIIKIWTCDFLMMRWMHFYCITGIFCVMTMHTWSRHSHIEDLNRDFLSYANVLQNRWPLAKILDRRTVYLENFSCLNNT